MNLGNGLLMVDEVTKFYETLHITGWYHHPTEVLSDLRLSGVEVLAHHTRISDPRPADAVIGLRHQTFTLHCLTGEDAVDERHHLELRLGRRTRVRLSLAALSDDRIAHYRSRQIWRRFVDDVVALPHADVLAVGGRDRSNSGALPTFGAHRVTNLDVLPAPEVDLVADIHELDRFGDVGPFDAFFSDSVFEHLAMPWLAVVQINRVLRDGATGFVGAPQTIGMHDLPWDFWRISGAGWDALFNRYTGFEILDRCDDYPCYAIPVVSRPDIRDVEHARGFERSVVLVRKIGPATVDWPVRVSDIIATMYPTG